jgi:hypothetical protein
LVNAWRRGQLADVDGEKVKAMIPGKGVWLEVEVLAIELLPGTVTMFQTIQRVF